MVVFLVKINKNTYPKGRALVQIYRVVPITKRGNWQLSCFLCRCQCAVNWHGIRCSESHDDCDGASSSELCGQGTCVNTPRVQPGQVCTCVILCLRLTQTGKLIK